MRKQHFSGGTGLLGELEGGSTQNNQTVVIERAPLEQGQTVVGESKKIPSQMDTPDAPEVGETELSVVWGQKSPGTKQSIKSKERSTQAKRLLGITGGRDGKRKNKKNHSIGVIRNLPVWLKKRRNPGRPLYQRRGETSAGRKTTNSWAK